MKNNTIIFCSIKFYNYTFKKINLILKKGGYLVAPAASSLSTLKKNKKYYLALKKSKIAILDSGYFCILLRIFKKHKITKYSGYLFLKDFLSKNIFTQKLILSIDPSLNEKKLNQHFYRSRNIKSFSYVAPFYKYNFRDLKLFNLIKLKKPDYILINIAGEKQEILAMEINEYFRSKIPIICTGAAIGFLTGNQAPINDTLDKFYLGWLTRLFHNPKVHLKRVFLSVSLIKLFF